MTPHHTRNNATERPKGWLIALAVGSALLCSPYVSYAKPTIYEVPPTLSASKLLTPELRAGQYHTVDEKVVNDGFMKHYQINSKYGEFEAGSTAELKERIREIYAIAEMDKVESSDTFVESVKEGGMDVVTGVKDIVVHPIDTVSNAISGVGSMFRRAGARVFGDPKSDQEDSQIKSIIGFSKTKREYAADYGVDV